MKSASKMASLRFRNFKPCVHGADVFEAKAKAGLISNEISDFSSSVNPLGASVKVLEAIKENLGLISRYPDSNSTILRETIARHYGSLSKENIIIGNGSTELIYLFAEAFLQRGNIALVGAPSFGEYEKAVLRAGKKVKYVRLGKDFLLDSDLVISNMGEKVKIIFLCNPNNPTSLLTKTEDLLKIVENAFEKDVLVFLDEDFLEFVDESSKLSLINRVEEFPNLFVLRSFTKLHGLTGLRVGYGVASKEIVEILVKAKIPWNLNCLGQIAAMAALSDEEHLRKSLALVKEEKSFLMRELEKFEGFKVYPPDANFFFIDIHNCGFSAAQLKEKLLTYGVLIRDCSSFAGLDKYYIRIAVKTRSENEKLIGALKKSLQTKA
ncbi:MAG: histidinol-phosphate transaminase [Candidatus Bathyarchaeota archaeon]|nr:histidinol-phosphate transaminase [Candidatus Bathyarchaeota archaeon]